MGREPLAAVFTVLAMLAPPGGQAVDPAWSSAFEAERPYLVATGVNPWFNLTPGNTLALEGGGTRLVITVLDETRVLDGVTTRVVEERETEDGQLVEVSRNFFAISTRTNAVFYFGEEVDIYEKGRVVGHEGAWLSGTGGARFGLMMPGLPLRGSRYYQEVAPGVAMDRAEIVGLDETVVTPAGTFRGVLKVDETTPLERGVREYKYYARDVGLIQDGELKIVRKQGGTELRPITARESSRPRSRT